MPEPHASSGSWVTRWRQRVSSRAARWFWGALFLGGFGAWLWLVHRWAAHHGHAGWLEGDRPDYILVAALTYWPPVIALWALLFPADHRALPWDDTHDEP